MDTQNALERWIDKKGQSSSIQQITSRLAERYAQHNSTEQTQPERRIELVLIIDTTASMSPFLDLVKRKFGDLLQHLCNQEALRGLRFSVVFYKDHDSKKHAYDVKEFSRSTQDGKSSHFATKDEIDEVMQFIHTYGNCSYGGNAEALGAALYQVSQFKWAASQRIVISLGDKPSHGYHDFGGDDSLDLCPYRMDHQQIIRLYRSKHIKIFSVCCGDFAPTQQQYQDLAKSTGGAYIEFDKLDSLDDILLFLELALKSAANLVSPKQFLADSRAKHLIGQRTYAALLSAFRESN